MKAADILISHNLKRTGCREGIIEVVLNSAQALSENEIRERLSGDYDRTTFYRSFKTLEEQNILHKIVVDNKLVKFALDNSITHKREHAHFYCKECHSVKCMESVPVSRYQLPDGYSFKEADVLIKGTCDNCQDQ
jgi:Fur family ferric uptake transcriptional regulator